jgi:hypothetical protein
MSENEQVTITTRKYRILTEAFSWMWEHHREELMALLTTLVPPKPSDPDTKDAA